MYSDLRTREDSALWLKKQASVPVEIIRLTPETIYLGEIIQVFPAVPRRCFLFFDVESAFPKILGYLNLNREKLFQLGHALVFWVRREGLRRIAEEAPDFWAWRSRVLDFRTGEKPERGQIGLHDSVIGHYTLEQIQRQLESLEESGGSDLASQLALGRRYLALGEFERAEAPLERARAEAERQGDQLGLAAVLYLLGHCRFAHGFFDEADSLYSNSLKIACEIGSNEVISAAARQLSVVALHNGDMDSAIGYANTMMQIAILSGNLTALAGAHDHMGSILAGSDDPRGAEQEYLAAVKYEEQLGHRSDLALTLGKLAHVYEEMGDSARAESVRKRAQDINSSLQISPSRQSESS